MFVEHTQLGELTRRCNKELLSRLVKEERDRYELGGKEVQGNKAAD